jgi:hypothetical protein
MPASSSSVFFLDLGSPKTPERVFFQWIGDTLLALRARLPGGAPHSSLPFEDAAWMLIAQAQAEAAALAPDAPGAAGARAWVRRIAAIGAGDAGADALARAFGQGALEWRETLFDEDGLEPLFVPAREAPDAAPAWGRPQTLSEALAAPGAALCRRAAEWAKPRRPEAPPEERIGVERAAKAEAL